MTQREHDITAGDKRLSDFHSADGTIDIRAFIEHSLAHIQSQPVPEAVVALFESKGAPVPTLEDSAVSATLLFIDSVLVETGPVTSLRIASEIAKQAVTLAAIHGHLVDIQNRTEATASTKGCDKIRPFLTGHA